MKVKSKFKIGDYVWLVSENKVIKQDITGVGISINLGDKPEIKYTLHYDNEVTEDKVFSTKEELLESL